MLNVGDQVIIKKDASTTPPSHPISFNAIMNEYAGKRAVVFEVRSKYGCKEYYLKLLNGEPVGRHGVNGCGFWYWDENWLEPDNVEPIDISVDDLIGAFV
jgi:hypothetical protein